MNSTRIYPMTVEPRKVSEFILENDWNYSFCSCCDDTKTCCLGTFCLPCLICSISLQAKEGCSGGCKACLCPQLLGVLRTKIRGTLRIYGTILEDCCYVCCCLCCAAIQIKKELNLLESQDENF